MKKLYIMIFIIIISLVAIIASSIPFRQYPTHMVVKQVNCISCHSYEFEDLKDGYHIRKMDFTQNRFLYDYVGMYGNVSDSAYKTLVAPCYSCHVTYENYNRFGLTDPYVFGNANIAFDAQYGNIVNWPEGYQVGNLAVEYFGSGNVAITAELEVLSLTPSNSAIDSTMKIILKNYSGQQNVDTVCDCAATLYQGDTHVVSVSNMKNDYFNILLLLGGTWNNSILNLRVSGTDKGTESFIINANSPPVIYDVPSQISNKSYFKTNGSYKAVRLDYVWTEWKNYTIGNIASSETIETNTTNGWVIANTCSTPDAWCHINQKATSMGFSDGINPDKSFFTHYMEFVTSKQCRICHMKNSLI